jgi:DNA-binding LytR/AlgR family response regulator
VRCGHAERRVLCSEIHSISADRDYAVIELHGTSLLVRSTMAALEDELDPEQFIRVHRSYIVAVDCIEEVRTLGPNRHEIRLNDGQRIPVGRTFWPKLRQQLRSYKASRIPAAS